MNGPSDTARTLAREAVGRKGVPASYADRALDAAYPTIRNDVIEEIKAAIHARGPSTYPAQSNWNLIQSYIDFIDDLKEPNDSV